MLGAPIAWFRGGVHVEMEQGTFHVPNDANASASFEAGALADRQVSPTAS
jgi:hypothetical protein